MVKLIVGLGNPGIEYQLTRHNIGFLVVERLAKEVEVKFSRRKFNSRIARKRLADKEVILAKPYTYMNLSGKAVLSLLNWANLNLKDLLVVCDDMNLKFATMRIRSRGSSGGHNGLKSIIDYLGTENFPRLRLGIGPVCVREEVGDREIRRYVLAQFTLQQKELMGEFIERAALACRVWITQGIEVAMRRFNARR